MVRSALEVGTAVALWVDKVSILDQHQTRIIVVFSLGLAVHKQLGEDQDSERLPQFQQMFIQKIANAVLGRPGAGGGWAGGFTGQGAYDEHQTCAGAGGGSGYIGGVQNGTTYGYGETGFSIAPWTSLEPADKNGIVKMKVTDYSGGVE